MTATILKPRGTKDLFGSDLLLYQEICARLKKLFVVFGYEEIKTPIYEKIEVFNKLDASGLTANKEFFYIKDRKNSDSINDTDTYSYVLRPELTAPVVRALIENNLLNRQTESKIHSYFYIGECFRYDRPQEGRYRQFLQAGIERFGSSEIYQDIENILLLKSIPEIFNLNKSKIQIRINYFGSSKTKKKWNDALKIYFNQNLDKLPSEFVNRVEINPFRIFDESKKVSPELISGAPKIFEYYSDSEKECFEKFKDFFSKHSDIIWDPCLVRGLDYYTGLIYELVDLNSGLSMAAGGRYDDLVENFYGKQIPALGLAIGVDRLKLFLEKQGFSAAPEPKIVLYSSVELDPDLFWSKVFKFKQQSLLKDSVYRVIVERKQGITKKQLEDKYGSYIEKYDLQLQ